MVYFYRPKNFGGSAIGYKIRHNNDVVIGRVRNGEKFTFKTQDFGRQLFWAKTESQDAITLDVQRGQEYFVRCGLKAGILIGVPYLLPIENYLGIDEYVQMK